MTPFAAIDFETAGYDPASACSLGVVAASEDGSVTEWHRLIRPPVMRFAPGCIAIHGIRPEDVEDKPEFPAFWPEIASLLRGRVVFAHNAQFDMGVLGATLDRYDLPEVPFRFGCTARLARHVWAGLPRHKLDVVAGALGFSFRHHDALDDSRACAFIVRKALERNWPGRENRPAAERAAVRRVCRKGWCAWRGSNPQPSAPEADALSNWATGASGDGKRGISLADQSPERKRKVIAVFRAAGIVHCVDRTNPSAIVRLHFLNFENLASETLFKFSHF